MFDIHTSYGSWKYAYRMYLYGKGTLTAVCIRKVEKFLVSWMLDVKGRKEKAVLLTLWPNQPISIPFFPIWPKRGFLFRIVGLQRDTRHFQSPFPFSFWGEMKTFLFLMELTIPIATITQWVYSLLDTIIGQTIYRAETMSHFHLLDNPDSHICNLVEMIRKTHLIIRNVLCD